MREEANGIQALCVWQHTIERYKAVAWLEAGDAAVRCGPENRTARLRAERERHHAGSHRRRRTAGAAARCVLEVARIVRWSRRAVGEGGRVGFAEQDCPAAPQ